MSTLLQCEYIHIISLKQTILFVELLNIKKIKIVCNRSNQSVNFRISFPIDFSYYLTGI